MDNSKKKLLEDSYTRIVNVGFCLVPYQDLSDILDPDVMIFGTTKDEKIFSLKELTSFFRSQYEQMGDMKPTIKRERLSTITSDDGNNASIVEEMVLSIASDEVSNDLYLRTSCILEYKDDRWKLTHWHSSTPVNTENDHWHLEEWKREKEKLQKLVAQQTEDLLKKNRELKIEAALDRVRTRTMAMHKTDELQDIINTVYQQFLQLEIEITGGAFIAINSDIDSELICWGAGGTADYIERVHLPYMDMPIYTNLIEGIKKGPGFFTEEFTQKEKKLFFKELFRVPLYSKSTEDHKVEVLSRPGGYTRSCIVSPYTSIFIINHHGRPFTKEENETLKRMGKVFEQTYTRFLDLQKAEDQAREAEIEAALERIRTASMTMHQTDDISDVVLVFFSQLKELNIHFVQAWITVFHLDEGYFDIWLSPLDGIYNEPTHLQMPSAMFEDTSIKAWRDGKTFSYVSFKTKQEVEALFQACDEATDSDYFAQLQKKLQLERLEFTDANYKYGTVSKSGDVPATEEEEEILHRFAKVFEQTYTRFLDLQKAEKQAREAEIELALERVRAKAMAMHNSNDVGNATGILFQELQRLGIETLRCGVGIFKNEHDMEIWSAVASKEGGMSLAIGELSLTIHPMLEGAYHSWKNKEPRYSYALKGKDMESYYRIIYNQPDLKLPQQDILNLEQTFHCTWYPEGGLYAITEDPLDESSLEIFDRFGKVFRLTYRRYLDLKDAEAQAREAQIEAALERVRSQAMAMHNTSDLANANSVVFEELTSLGISPLRSGIGLIDPESKIGTMYATALSEKQNNLLLIGEISLTNHHVLESIYDGWRNKRLYHVELNGKDLEQYYDMLLASYGDLPKPEFSNEETQHGYFIPFEHGAFYAWTREPYPDEDLRTIERFTSVINLTYNRYFDLQKAEEQAREAQIEAALERIRTKTIAMQNTDDIADTVVTFFEELVGLGLDSNMRVGIGILSQTEEMKFWTASVTDDSETILHTGFLDMSLHPLLKGAKNTWKEGDPYFTYMLEGKDVKNYFRTLNEAPDFPAQFDLNNLPESVHHRSYVFKDGLLYTFTESNLPEDIIKTMERFAAVFGQTYTRYLDLKKAEKQAVEATKQATLDRVRGEIASMRSAEDLEIITPLIWRELTTLGIPFIRCGVFIINGEEKEVEVYLSKPDGTSLAVMHLPFNSSDLASDAVSSWEQKKVMTVHWTQEEFLQWGQSMMEQSQVPDMETYKGSEEAPESLDLHFIPFKQGMLYVGSTSLLTDEEIDLVTSLAKAFAIAYARYEDFVKLEKAKAGIENALTELRSTQDQLIQQEKLASLGQLTAGIAHEIKNPLNFVNNFSDLSAELIHEVREVLSDVENIPGDAYEILNDIESNLKKIYEHGTRADSIVKSMLEHSRGSSGKMEETDLNHLLREFVNLSFHGMRAGKDPINVDIDYEMDESVGEIPLVAEDFSRVIVNLCNNAFDALREKVKVKSEKGEAFSPSLTVRTIQNNESVIIEIEDNGPGIPDEIKDKIMQPFFTTKKGTQGTGLGLSITNDIIKAHGGFMSVDTGEGFTRFTIELNK